MSEKRYYWLKLQEDYFQSLKIKKLRKIAGGDTYTIIYLKIQLLSLRNGGKVIFEGVESSLAEELALQLDEDLENVKITLAYMQANGMIERSDEEPEEYALPETMKSIGNEGSSTQRVRRFREKQKAIEINSKNKAKPLQCNADETQGNAAGVTSVTPKLHCYGDIDIEKDIDKEKDVEKEVEKKKKKAANASGQLAEPCGRIISHLNEKTGRKYKATRKDTQRLIAARLKEGFSEDDFYKVIDKKCAAWADDPKMSEYLRPETLFSAKHFESYLQQPWPTSQTKAGAGYAFENTAWDDVQEIGEVNF